MNLFLNIICLIFGAILGNMLGILVVYFLKNKK